MRLFWSHSRAKRTKFFENYELITVIGGHFPLITGNPKNSKPRSSRVLDSDVLGSSHPPPHTHTRTNTQTTGHKSLTYTMLTCLSVSGQFFSIRTYINCDGFSIFMKFSAKFRRNFWIFCLFWSRNWRICAQFPHSRTFTEESFLWKIQ